MTTRMIKRLPAPVAIVFWTLSLLVRADTPDVYAIRGARIVAVAGATIETGTVVLKNGAIEAVGAAVPVPHDAVVIEGRGLTVYPGLIDLGNLAVVETLNQPQLQNARTTAEVERWKRQRLLRPQARAADVVKSDETAMMRLAASGVTTVLALPSGEVFPGQSALVNVSPPPERPPVGSLANPRRPLVLLKTPIALHVSFPPRPRIGTNAYPISLMGVIAFVRQAFLDAQYYGLQQARGRVPPDDPAMAALLPALDRTLPVAFEANEQREILRALALARELNLDPIITGAREAPLVTADLTAQGARVIFSLNYPRRARDLAPDADEPLRLLAARADAPKAPGELARHQVKFGFASAGLSDPKDFIRNAAKAVTAGLSREDAIRALTLDAAAIAGVEERLGSITRGKAATLIVTDGDLFAEKTRVLRVFVNGRPVALDSGPRPTGP
jgi:imidazolonepropionase-like amidohydrolase